jgi:hypothetical protein
MARQDDERIGRLLLKAVRQLPQRDQDVILRYLMTSFVGRRSDVGPQAMASTMVATDPLSSPSLQIGFHGAPTGPGQQTLPVRLSEKQHRELRDWCGRHNFSMAVVIRGLVERFLEAQRSGEEEGGHSPR